MRTRQSLPGFCVASDLDDERIPMWICPEVRQNLPHSGGGRRNNNLSMDVLDRLPRGLLQSTYCATRSDLCAESGPLISVLSFRDDTGELA